MSGFDINERTFLPKYMVRPQPPERVVSQEELEARSTHCYTSEEMRQQSEQDWAYEHAWQLVYDRPSEYIQKGWQVRPLRPGRLIKKMPAHADGYQAARDEERRKHNDRIAQWADGFISDTGTPDLVWPEDREDVLIEVARRLREATADGFLLRALEVDHAA